MTQLAQYAASSLPFKSLVLEHEFWSNPRSQTALDAAAIAEMADDMATRRKNGKPPIQVPLMVVQAKKPDSDEILNVVFDGQRRVLAGREGAIKPNDEVPIQFMTDSPIVLTWEKSDELLLDVMGLTVRRAGLSSYEISEVAERLRNRDKPLANIGQAIGKSESWVSRFLTARKNASAATLKAWKDGDLTDEEFKDLSQIDKDKQTEALKDADDAAKKTAATTKNTREVKAEKRNKIKESAAAAKTAKTAAKATAAAVTKGKQPDLFVETKPEPKPLPSIKAPSKHELEAVLEMAEKRPPTHDYVKGVVEGVRYALGGITPDLFARPWGTYIARVGGTMAVRPKKAKAPRKAKSKKAKKR